jgi:hypothetical protein
MPSSKKIKLSIVLVILLSSILLSITMFRSGLKYNFGLGFWGPNGHDAIWHLSLINQLKQNIPPQNPIYSGTILSNYHWGFDFFVALISNLTKLDSSFLYFQILPIIFAILIGLLSYKLAFLLTKKHIASLFFVVLNYFAGSFGWIFTLIKDGHFAGESLFWSMQSASTLLNPPYALSLIILLIGLILWVKYQKSNSILKAILIGLVFALLSGIKVYAGILIGVALSLFWLFDWIHSKKFSKFNFFICLSTGIVSLSILFSLGVFHNSQLLEFKPFWFVNSMIESIDKLYWPKLASYRFNQTNFLISILIEIFLIGVFFIGNLGIRILGIFKLFFDGIKNRLNQFDILTIFILIFSFFIPLLFVQKGTAWNTIQFFYYFLFFINLYLAKFLSNTYSKNKTIAFVLLIITCLTSIGTLKDYFGNPPPSALPQTEIQALSFLKNQPSGNVLTYPYDKYLKNKMVTPIPLYAYETTSYVSAFSQKPTFLEDEMNLDITGFNWQSRRTDSEKFFTSQDKFFARGFLINNQIGYIYLVNQQKINLNQEDLQINQIYDHDGIKIYQVRK